MPFGESLLAFDQLGVHTLERKLGGQLDAPRAAASKKRIADAHVTCRDNVVEAVAHLPSPGSRCESASAGGSDTDVGSGIGNERRQERTREVWMIDNVEEIGPELDAQAFADLGVLVDRQVPLLEWRPTSALRPRLPKCRVPGTQSAAAPDIVPLLVQGMANELRFRKLFGS